MTRRMNTINKYKKKANVVLKMSQSSLLEINKECDGGLSESRRLRGVRKG